MPDEVLFEEAKQAIERGKLVRARDLLTRLLRTDQNNPTYWLLMSAAVETDKERLYCLRNVLRLDPQNVTARQGLSFFGGMESSYSPRPYPISRRKWKSEFKLESQPSLIREVLGKGGLRVLSTLLTAGVVIGVLIFVILSTNNSAAPVFIPPTKTPGPPPTFTPTPTYLGYIAPADATTLPTNSAQPLWMRLATTYTPTPIYVNTPHPISEAFRAGQQAYNLGDWETALSFFNQAALVESTAADIPYYIGEVERMRKNYRFAQAAYNQSIKLDSEFAPAYLGRARVSLALNPRAKILEDLNQVILLDANLAEAYLERASYTLGMGDYTEFEKDLKKAGQLLPDSPLPYLYQAQAFLAQGMYDKALEQAKIANNMDLTLLPSYKAYGEAALYTGDAEIAAEMLETYLMYADQNPSVWLLLGKARANLISIEILQTALIQPDSMHDYKSALQAFDTAYQQLGGNTTIQEKSEVSLLRGLIYLQSEQGQLAVNDLIAARQFVYALTSPLNDLSPQAKSLAVGEKPLWFTYNIAMARAFSNAARHQNALDQLDFAYTLAKTNQQKAAVYYWRALTHEALENQTLARRDWMALLALPESSINSDWLPVAQEREATYSAPSATPIPTNTRTLTPKPTLTPSRTSIPTLRLTPTKNN